MNSTVQVGLPSCTLLKQREMGVLNLRKEPSGPALKHCAKPDPTPDFSFLQIAGPLLLPDHRFALSDYLRALNARTLQIV